MTYEIHTDIPMPPRINGNTKYPWRTLPVGGRFQMFDSVSPRNKAIAYSNTAKASKATGFKFAWAAHEGAVWIWRVA